MKKMFRADTLEVEEKIMKTLRMKMALSAVTALALAAQTGCSTETTQRSIAATHSDTTPYSAFRKAQLQMKSGESYLDFMQEKVQPAIKLFQDAIKTEEAKNPKQYSKWQTDLIAQGAGVAIRINAKNYFFNVGYGDGSSADDIKSGRSYGVGPTNRESDPSDEFYLTELENYLKSEPKQAGTFYKAIMQALTDCDTSGWSDLSTAGQMVATDFMAIYTAESARHLMVNLKATAHPWEIDLAAATFVSVFDAATGMMNQKDGGDFKLVKGSIGQWWAKGQQGSGIGETRGARTDLSEKISAYEAKKHPDLISEIEAVVGKTRGNDVIQGTFEYLNTPPKGPSDFDSDKAEKLTDAMVKFIEQVQADAPGMVDDL